MGNILDELTDYARYRVEEYKKSVPLSEMRYQAERMGRLTMNCKGLFPMEEALKADGLHFICECKKASPSKGLIAANFPYIDIAKSYEEAGASAISVLTEPKWFLGKDSYLREIANRVHIPVLRKDFTVDIQNSIRLRELAPEGTIFIAESGIKSPQDVQELRQHGVNGVLVGEQLMRANSPGEELARLRGE